MPNYEKSAMQRLSKTSDVMEIWWDSSPILFKAWEKEMLEKADPSKRDKLKGQLKILIDIDNPVGTLFDGVTTNPKLTSTALSILSEELTPIVDEIIEGNKAKNDYLLALETYKEITKRGTALYMPLFEKSGYRRDMYLPGWIQDL